MRNNILVVGGTGFIGYHLLKYLKKKKIHYFQYQKISPQKKEKLGV